MRAPLSTSPLVRAAVPAAMAVVLGAGPGCGPRVILAPSEADGLREQNLQLRDEVERLAGRVDELEAELDRVAAERPAADPEIAAASPHPVRLRVDRLSHARDTDGDGRADLLRVYVVPADGFDRFVQLVGPLDVHAAMLPADGPAVTIGQRRLAPGAVREAWRSSVMGTHYLVDLPLALPATAAGDDRTCTVRVAFTDGATGRTLAAERPVSLKP